MFISYCVRNDQYSDKAFGFSTKNPTFLPLFKADPGEISFVRDHSVDDEVSKLLSSLFQSPLTLLRFAGGTVQVFL